MKTVIRRKPNTVRYYSKATYLLILFTLPLLHNVAVGQTLALPDHAVQVMLVKNTLTAVNQGSITGNYTVLRDLASESFRQKNTAADLAETFGKLREQKLDLSPILTTEPKLTQPLGFDDFQRRIRLVGYFPTRPQAVKFSLIFRHVAAGWVIDEVSLAVNPIESVENPQVSPRVAYRD